MGVIVNVYHGTNEDFEEFSFSNVGKSNGLNSGFGLYFTELEADAFCYGENVFECVLTLKNPIERDKITLNYSDVERIIDSCNENGSNDFYENYQYYYGDYKNKAITELMESSISDIEIIGNLINSGVSIDILMSVLSDFGYTHTTDEKGFENNCTHYIVYDLKAIQIINKYTLETR